MVDLSLHLLDLMQNSASAGAHKVWVLIRQDVEEDRLQISVTDDGRGMSEEELRLVRDPFYTSARKSVGLGLPLIIQASEMAGGTVTIRSTEGRGTEVSVLFRLSHVDRQPLGDPVSTIVSFMAGNPDVAVEFTYKGPGGEFCFDSDKIVPREERDAMGQIPFLSLVEDRLREGLALASYRPDGGGFIFEEHRRA
ncbi:MAG: ATP-binding protein [Bacillota bacterium]